MSRLDTPSVGEEAPKGFFRKVREKTLHTAQRVASTMVLAAGVSSPFAHAQSTQPPAPPTAPKTWGGDGTRARGSLSPEEYKSALLMSALQDQYGPGVSVGGVVSHVGDTNIAVAGNFEFQKNRRAIAGVIAGKPTDSSVVSLAGGHEEVDADKALDGQGRFTGKKLGQTFLRMDAKMQATQSVSGKVHVQKNHAGSKDLGSGMEYSGGESREYGVSGMYQIQGVDAKFGVQRQSVQPNGEQKTTVTSPTAGLNIYGSGWKTELDAARGRVEAKYSQVLSEQVLGTVGYEKNKYADPRYTARVTIYLDGKAKDAVTQKMGSLNVDPTEQARAIMAKHLFNPAQQIGKARANANVPVGAFDMPPPVVNNGTVVFTFPSVTPTATTARSFVATNTPITTTNPATSTSDTSEVTYTLKINGVPKGVYKPNDTASFSSVPGIYDYVVVKNDKGVLNQVTGSFEVPNTLSTLTVTEGGSRTLTAPVGTMALSAPVTFNVPEGDSLMVAVAAGAFMHIDGSPESKTGFVTLLPGRHRVIVGKPTEATNTQAQLAWTDMKDPKKNGSILFDVQAEKPIDQPGSITLTQSAIDPNTGMVNVHIEANDPNGIKDHTVRVKYVDGFNGNVSYVTLSSGSGKPATDITFCAWNYAGGSTLTVESSITDTLGNTTNRNGTPFIVSI